ncbi:MAG: methyl-accepting chemotaxis protein [Clostridium sp.]|jgi:methyl-accepting chemotaxis protein|nr:methyl-accepting chemotaxis protein [Clostridium sp.]
MKSDLSRLNRTAILDHALIDIVLFAAYILEFVKGSRTVEYTIGFSIFALAPIIFEIIFHRFKRDSKLTRYIIAITYLSLYTFVIFTTTSGLAFTYIIPMYMVVILYSDVLYCIIVCTLGILINVAHMIYYATTFGYSDPSEITDLEIRVALLVLCLIFSALSTSVMNKINQEKLRKINEDKEKSDALLEKILRTSDAMILGIGQSEEHMNTFDQSVRFIQNSMEEVTKGNTETANAIQVQQQKTAQIQEYIAQVREAATTIDTNMSETSDLVSDGKKQMNLLETQIENSLKSTELIQKKTAQLNDQTKEMNAIIGIISSVANRTEILALNASIEAARAGELGKGFAVVAQEVSSLANQTKSATVNITKLIRTVTEELVDVSRAVNQMTVDSRSNQEVSQESLEHFIKMEAATQETAKQTQGMKSNVEELEAANHNIVDSIQTISAITEEVAAHSSETLNACIKNSELVDNMSQIVSNLSTNATELKAQV